MYMNLSDIQSSHYKQNFQRIEKAVNFILENWREQPSLSQMSELAGLSEYHFQKMFKLYTGLSPKRFLQFITAKAAKSFIDTSASLLQASFESGLSSTSRIYDLFVVSEAVTPGQYKTRGDGLEIFYDFYDGPFGMFLLALTEKGICSLKFCNPDGRTDLEQWLSRFWKNAVFRKDRNKTEQIAGNIICAFEGRQAGTVNLHLRGSNFELKTWQALLNIPSGKLESYKSLAVKIGTPGACRAVGSALGRNPVPYLVPCHRVIKSSGIFGNYAEGPARKAIFISRELSSDLNFS
jgi:AraC family transcriptional regulator, regulatory protein of adaptative response / methylated-DNA-[protein]-cysteine methyltransferase